MAPIWTGIAYHATQLAPLLEDDGGNIPYAESAGSFEVMPQDEPEPLPGKGEVSWGSLREIADDLRSVEEDVDLPDLSLRRNSKRSSTSALKLRRFAPHLPREAVRLFLAAPSVADVARHLVDAWVGFWQGHGETAA